MCDFSDFRTLAREAFPTLIVSVMMYEKGSGVGGEITMYRLKVSGQGIGADITKQNTSAAAVVAEMVEAVGAARRRMRQARYARLMSNRTIAVRPTIAQAA